MTNPIPFQLLAPNNPQVSLLGNWNGWQPHPMRKGADGYWRAEIPLEDGDYLYVFEVVSNSPRLQGRKIQVPDPCALEWTQDDKTRLKIVQGAIQHVGHHWQHDDTALPPNEALIIYELHVGDFSGGEGDEKPGGAPGTFQDLIGKLDYLSDLGINAIELMPVTAGPPGHQLGYSQRTFFALNERYGSASDFARLVDACHSRGIRVIHDSVYNHMATDAIWGMIDFDYWFFEKNPDEFDFGPKLDYDKRDPLRDDQPVKEYALASMRLWMEQFHLDGIRFDYARALSFDLLRDFRDLLRKLAQPRDFFAIAEHLPENPSVVGENGPLDSAWTQTLLTQLLSTALGKPHREQVPLDATAVARAFDWRVMGYESAHHVINYLESHDEPHLMTILDDNPNLSREARFRRAKLVAALLLCAPGVPMLWMGQEFGESGPKPEGPQPLRWRLLQEPDHHDLWMHYRKLIHLRRQNPALYSDNLRILLADQNDLVVAFLRRDSDQGNDIIVIANLQDKPLPCYEVDIAKIGAGHYRDLLSDTKLDLTSPTATISLAPSQVLILRRD